MVAHLGLGGRRVDGLGQLGGVGQAFGQGNAADRARFLVFLPAAAGQVAAHHGLDQHGLEALDQHGAARDLGHFGGRDHGFGRFAGQVVGADVAEFVEPEQRHLRQQLALAGDGLAHDHVKGREAVRGHHQDAVIAHGIVVAHLAAREQRQRGNVGSVQGGGTGLGGHVRQGAIWQRGCRGRRAASGTRRSAILPNGASR